MSQQIAQTRAIEPTGDGEQDPAATNIRRRLGNWTATSNGATAPMAADTANLVTNQDVSSPTVPLDGAGSTPLQTVQLLRTGLAPENVTAPIGVKAMNLFVKSISRGSRLTARF